jgi:hypothetical protein
MRRHADEIELRRLADALYRRVDWRWAQRDDGAVMRWAGSPNAAS